MFKTIGRFDETFDFYSADNDELLTLRKYAIPNVLVTESEVKHLSQVVTKKVGVNKYAVTDKNLYPISDLELMHRRYWLWNDYRLYIAYRRAEAKWGNEWMIKRINHFFERHLWLNIRPITKLLYNKKMNLVLAKLTGLADPNPVKYSE